MSAFWQKTMSQALQLRHELHTYPELGWQEQRTAARIRSALTDLDIPWRECAETGTVAWLNRHSKASVSIALRGDIDALPIHETTGKPYSSQHAGCMHACGHDGHTATLMASAAWLKHHEDQLAGPVALLFQPAEEGGHGAARMIEDGALEGVDEVYGWHNWPAIPFGQLACPDDIVMCGNGVFRLTLEGQGGHASQPELCRNPVVAASAVVMALQQIVAQRLPPQQAAVVAVTSIEAPSGPTIVPSRSVIGGSIRVPDKTTRATVNRLIGEISQQVAQSYGVQCSVVHEPRYDATINHAAQARRVRDIWCEEFGEKGLDQESRMPIMASEDFSYYLQHRPGAFALVGAGDGEQHHQVPCHSPQYDFNDRLIPMVTRLYARLAGAPLPPLADPP